MKMVMLIIIILIKLLFIQFIIIAIPFEGFRHCYLENRYLIVLIYFGPAIKILARLYR